MVKVSIFPTCTEFMVNRNALCDISFCYLKIFSEGNYFGVEDQEFVDTPLVQGKPHEPLHKALQ